MQANPQDVFQFKHMAEKKFKCSYLSYIEKQNDFDLLNWICLKEIFLPQAKVFNFQYLLNLLCVTKHFLVVLLNICTKT